MTRPPTATPPEPEGPNLLAEPRTNSTSSRAVLAAAAGLLSALLLGGCTPTAPEPVGTLDSLPAPSVSASRTAQIGTATIAEPVAVYDAPGGVTIGRTGEGTWPLMGVEDGWAKIEIGEVAYGWVVADQVKITLG